MSRRSRHEQSGPERGAPVGSPLSSPEPSISPCVNPRRISHDAGGTQTLGFACSPNTLNGHSGVCRSPMTLSAHSWDDVKRNRTEYRLTGADRKSEACSAGRTSTLGSVCKFAAIYLDGIQCPFSKGHSHHPRRETRLPTCLGFRHSDQEPRLPSPRPSRNRSAPDTELPLPGIRPCQRSLGRAQRIEEFFRAPDLVLHLADLAFQKRLDIESRLG